MSLDELLNSIASWWQLPNVQLGHWPTPEEQGFKTFPDGSISLRYSDIDPAKRDEMEQQAIGLANGMGGTRVLGRAGGSRLIEAFNDLTGKTTGKLGYTDVPGKGGILKNIMTYPEAHGQGYANEMLDRFAQEMGPNMNNVRIGDITNNPTFWNNLSSKWQSTYPDVANRISNRLTQASEQFGW